MSTPDEHRPTPWEDAGGTVSEPADVPADDGTPAPPRAVGEDAPSGAGGTRTRHDPDAEGWRGLHPLSVWANALVLGLVLFPAAIVAVVILVVVGQGLWGLAVFGGTVVMFAFFTYLDLLGLRATRYRVTDERIEMRSGIIAKAYRSVPRERVRSVDVAAPVYTRVLGLCSVTVGTGEKVAAGAEQFQLLYVTAEQGESLRRELLYRGAPRHAGSASDDDGTPAAEDGEIEVELARLDRRWFAFAPATPATVGVSVGVIATVLGANAQANGAPWRWISDRANLPSGEEMASFVVGQVLLVVPLALLGMLISGVIIVTAVAVETWWGYRLTREADGTVRLRRGLLTSVSLSVEGRRLNGVTLHEPFVLRSTGGADVRAVATGLGSADDEAAKAKSRLSPAMPRERARALAADLMRTRESPLDAPLAAHPRAALRRRLTRAGYATVVALVLAGVMAWLHTLASEAWWEAARGVEEYIVPVPLTVRALENTPGWGWAMVAVLFGAMAFWWAVGSYRSLGHGLHPRYLVLRQGMAVRRTVTLERTAVIGWRISRSPFQRRLGLANVAATTAAGEGMYAATDVGLGEGLNWADEAVPELLAPFLVRGGGPEGGDGPPGRL